MFNSLNITELYALDGKINHAIFRNRIRTNPVNRMTYLELCELSADIAAEITKRHAA